MSATVPYTPPNYFEQPYKILGYSVIGSFPQHGPSTLPIIHFSTWEKAWHQATTLLVANNPFGAYKIKTNAAPYGDPTAFTPDTHEMNNVRKQAECDYFQLWLLSYPNGPYGNPVTEYEVTVRPILSEEEQEQGQEVELPSSPCLGCGDAKCWSDCGMLPCGCIDVCRSCRFEDY
jgi:hypothetical protein